MYRIYVSTGITSYGMPVSVLKYLGNAKPNLTMNPKVQTQTFCNLFMLMFSVLPAAVPRSSL